MPRLFRNIKRLAGAGAGILMLLLLTAAPTFAHGVVTVGQYTVAIGWAHEPTYVDAQNAVQVVIKDASGKPIQDLTADALKVVVSTGGQTSSPLVLNNMYDPDTGLGIPGDYEAPITPTVPGDYTFHVTGSIDGTPIDQTMTSSDQTFNSAVGATDIQFPTKLPATGDIVNLLDRLGTRVTALEGGGNVQATIQQAQSQASAAASSAQNALDTANRAITLAVGAGVVGAVLGLLGLIVAYVAIRRVSRKPRGTPPRKFADVRRMKVAGRSALRVASWALVLALGLLLLLPGWAGAHALLQQSDPAVNSTVPTAPAAVTLWFGEAPDPKLSSVKVLDTHGASVAAGPAQPVPGSPLELKVPLEPLGNGVYTVAWRTVSAVDGHLATGSFAFGVGTVSASAVESTPGPAAGGTGSGGPSLLATAARWLYYLGLCALLGASVIALIVLPSPTRSSLWLALFGLIAAAAGAVIILLAEIADTGASLGDALGSSLGVSSFGRLAPLVLAAIGLAAAMSGRASWRRPGLVLAAIGAGASMLADVASSHAAAGALPIVNSAIQAVHIGAAGIWVGGLAALLLAIRGAPSHEKAHAIRRFSLVATAAIAIVVVSGLLRAAAELTGIGDLFTTDFGRLLLLKSALVVVLAALAAVNHFRHVPRAFHGIPGVRRVGGLELGVAAVILLATASLVNVAPPVEAAAAASAAGPGTSGASPAPTLAPVVVEGTDFGTTVRLRLEITPGTPGFDTFTATVTDYDTRQPVDAAGVTLRFSLPARPDVGGSTLRLTPTAPGVFSASGANLSIDGSWTVTALVDHGTASVEVNLTVQTQLPPQQVHINAVPGAPTIYTVHLDAGRTVQVYLDPGTAGSNDVHSTFFDASGTELPVPGASMTISPVPNASAQPGGTAAPGRRRCRFESWSRVTSWPPRSWPRAPTSS